MKKKLVLILMVGIIVSIVLSGCSAKKQPSEGWNQEKQTNSLSAEVPDQSTNDDSINATGDEAGGSKLSSRDLERTNDEGEVFFSVTLVNPLGQEKEGYISFMVFLNTHSVDLYSNPLNQSAKRFPIYWQAFIWTGLLR